MDKRSRRPIFLQTGFRTGGTWLWCRFRADPHIMALCEPLNELLASLTMDEMAKWTVERTGLGHPRLDAPYFQEYAELLNANGVGVHQYRMEFGLNGYFDDSDLGNEGLKPYLQCLIDIASAHSKIPVLKFTRALFRAAWLRRWFPSARQILLVRNPLLQFWSGYIQAVKHGNFTFLMIPLFALSRASSSGVPGIHTLLSPFNIPYIPLSGGECFKAYTEMAQRTAIEELFKMFLILFILSHEKSTPYADMVVDQQRLYRELDYRSTVEDRLSAEVGVRIDLSDVKAADTQAIMEMMSDPVGATLCSLAAEVVACFPKHGSASLDFVRSSAADLEQSARLTGYLFPV